MDREEGDRRGGEGKMGGNRHGRDRGLEEERGNIKEEEKKRDG